MGRNNLNGITIILMVNRTLTNFMRVLIKKNYFILFDKHTIIRIKIMQYLLIQS